MVAAGDGYGIGRDRKPFRVSPRRRWRKREERITEEEVAVGAVGEGILLFVKLVYYVYFLGHIWLFVSTFLF
jgi:hypothetical protein